MITSCFLFLFFFFTENRSRGRNHQTTRTSPHPLQPPPRQASKEKKKKHPQAVQRPRPSVRKEGQSDSIILESHGRPPPPARSAALQRRSYRRASLFDSLLFSACVSFLWTPVYQRPKSRDVTRVFLAEVLPSGF